MVGAGFSNDVVYAKNVNFAGAKSATISTDGQLIIGSTALNVGGTHLNIGNITSTDGSVLVTNGAGTINLKGISSANDLHVAKWIVNPALNSGGNQTTIQSAINNAVSGETIFIMPGTYTENLTLKAGVNLVAFTGDEATPNVIILGKCSFSAAGTVTISNIQLKTNGDNCIAVTGSAASIIYFDNCNFLSQSTNICISFSSSNSSANINLFQCKGNITGTGSYWSSSSAGSIILRSTFFSNTGTSTTSNSNSAGSIDINNCGMNTPFTTSGTGAIAIGNTDIDCSAINTTCLTVGGSGGGTFINLYLASGTASAISLGAGVNLLANSIIVSSNTNAMTGAGSLHYNNVSLVNSVGVNTTTVIRAGLITADPSAGFLGEQIRNFASSVSLSHGTPANLTSISLTAGVWDVSGVSTITFTGINAAIFLGISATSATLTGNSGDQQIAQATTVTNAANSLSIPSFRVVLTSPITYYLVSNQSFSTGTCSGNGRISATRVA